jgi:PAT family beta-lactamase induction signal transducer AmpG
LAATKYSDVFRDRNLAVLLLLGFSSGLPISLVGPTLQAWVTVEGVDLATIGLLTLVGIPYTWKILWAPFMDRYVPPFLGRRRGWLVITQVALGAGICAMAMLSPRTDMALLAGLALFVAFASASQDIVADAYRTDISKPAERGIVSALFVLGYRIALMVSGALALLLAAGTGWLPAIGWQNTYLLMAALMAIGIATTWWGREPEVESPPRTLQEAVVGPLKEFFSRHGAWMMLALIVLYKLGDAFALSLSTAFLLRGVGFGVDDVAYVNKVLGLAATLVGVLIGGAMMVRLGLYRSLMLFGILQAVSNLGYMALAIAGKSYALLFVAVGFDNLAGGMGTAAFVAFQMALCNHRFTAFQYAMLSGVAAIGRVYVGPAAGYMTDPKYLAMEWSTFFFITFLTALPGLALLWWKRTTVDALDGK